MASNVSVFGLTYGQYDNRHMQQILRAYGRLPSNPGSRALLFTGLFDLSKGLENDQIEGIKGWLHAGGIPDDFPHPSPAPVSIIPSGHLIVDDEESWGRENEEWEPYDPTAYESGGLPYNDGEDGMNSGNPSQLQFKTPAYEDEGDAEGVGDHEAKALRVANQIDVDDDDSDAYFDRDNGDGTDDHEGSAPGVVYPTKLDRDDDPDTELHQIAPKRLENECKICLEVMESADELAPKQITEQCDHDHEGRACLDCVQQQLTFNIQSGNLSLITCPLCPERFSPEEVKQYATAEAFARYDYLLIIARPDIIMCLGPGCESGQVHSDTSNPKMVCDTCQFATCAHHKLPWHEGETCEEFDCNDEQIERFEQAEATAKLLAKDHSKICPSCGQGVSKQDGCDHLHCMCGKEWCFVCLVSWDNILRLGDVAHIRSCDYHPDKVRKTKGQLEAGLTTMTNTVFGEAPSEALLQAREKQRVVRRREIREKAREATENRLKLEAAEREVEKRKLKESAVMPAPKKARPRLMPAWEER